MADETGGGKSEKPLPGGEPARRQANAGDSHDEFTAVMRRLLTLAASTGVLGAPLRPSRLIERIVEIAAQLLSARAASLLLIDEEKRDLVFEVALGPKAEEVKKLRVPLGQGIAGLVALSGEPMTVSNVEQDARQASAIAKAVGYWPRSILCVPLVVNEQVIGVLEVFDKEGTQSFTAVDMEVLGQFGNLAVLAIEQARSQRNLASLISDIVASCSGTPWDQGPGAAPLSPGRRGKEDAVYRRTVQLAQLVQEIAEMGDREVEACQALLGAFLEYLKSAPSSVSAHDLGGVAPFPLAGSRAE